MALTMQVKKKVDGFRLDVRLNLDGQTTVFVGPSGAGKTMTLQLIAGLTKPDSGLIRIQDNVVFDSDKGIEFPPLPQFTAGPGRAAFLQCGHAPLSFLPGKILRANGTGFGIGKKIEIAHVGIKALE